MTTPAKRILLLVCLWQTAFSLLVGAELRIGVASRVVTPDPLLPVSGGVGPSHPVSRKQGDLEVRALVLAEGDTRVAIVSADFLGFPSQLGNKARAQVKDIPPQNILIGASHTHSAPDCYGFPDSKGAFATDLKYLESVCAKMAEAINEALSHQQPAYLKIATAEAKGKIAYNYYAEQLYDPRCHVIQVISTDNKPIATLVNYAIHPEVIGSGQGILSPDLVGPLRERIQEKGGGFAIFMNSAQGGMVTADNRAGGGKENRTWEECGRIGALLADEALRIVDKAPVQKSPKLFCAARTISFPVESPLLQAVMKSSPLGYSPSPLNGERAGVRGETNTMRVSTQLNVVNIGNAQILTIPGEALPNIGYYLKRKMRGEHNLLFGLTNDAFGYILTKVDWGSFKRYNYVSRTCLGEMTGEILIEEGLKFVNACPVPEKLQ